MNRINILIADDHKLIRESWSYLLSADPRFNVIASCGNTEEAVEATQTLKPDVVLMDINIMPFSGFEATQKICKVSPLSKVIGISMHAHPAYVKKMLKSGASGYVTKNSSRQEMIDAIMEVQNGKKFLCKEISGIITDHLLHLKENAPDISLLSKRELQIIKFVREGFSSIEMAAELGIAVRTVETHRHNILKKLKLKNSASLVNFINMYSEFEDGF